MYDESCSTQYPQQCRYRTKCPPGCSDPACSTDPYRAQHCRRVKHCSRRPHTTCTPVTRQECSMKKLQSPKQVNISTHLSDYDYVFHLQVKRNICLPFATSGPEDEDCSQHGSYPAPAPAPVPQFVSSLQGYEAPPPALYPPDPYTSSQPQYFPPPVHQHQRTEELFTPSSEDEVFLPSQSDINVAAFYT